MSTSRNPLPDFPVSRTCRELQNALLAESRSRRWYIAAARRMEAARLHVAAHAFLFTAAQEKEHIDIFRGLLTAGGGMLPACTEEPLSLPEEPIRILWAAAMMEAEEGERLYPACAQTAREEGYPRVAMAFSRIAETEQTHAVRFRQYAKAMEDGSLFRSETCTGWLCLPCGQLHYASDAPVTCSACGTAAGQFIRSSFYPFAVGYSGR